MATARVLYSSHKEFFQQAVFAGWMDCHPQTIQAFAFCETSPIR
jgi:hypothetical protein